MPDVTDEQLRQMVAQGLSQREIARRTGIARATLYARFKRLGLAPAASTGERGPSTGDTLPVHPPPSTVDPPPSATDQLRLDLQAALTAALQPALTRLEALETGLARQSTGCVRRRPSTVEPSTLKRDWVHPAIVHRGPADLGAAAVEALGAMDRLRAASNQRGDSASCRHP